MKAFLTLVALTGLATPALAQTTPAPAPPPAASAAAPVQDCPALLAEIEPMRQRQQALQAQLQGNAQATEQNARNAQAVVNTSRAMGWATGLASLVPGVGYAASSLSAGATQQAIIAQQRATEATNQQGAATVQELVPLSQRLHALETQARAAGCL